ncbi:MAG: hypothetical protein PVG14_15435 [Anaerolineales bacterium]|jgi:hypothetical protein
MVIAECPACADNIEFNRQPQLRQRVVCPACSTELRVILATPEVELDIIKWDDDIPWNSKGGKWSKGPRRRMLPFDLDDEDEEGYRDDRKHKKRNKRKRRNHRQPPEDYDL